LRDCSSISRTLQNTMASEASQEEQNSSDEDFDESRVISLCMATFLTFKDNIPLSCSPSKFLIPASSITNNDEDKSKFLRKVLQVATPHLEVGEEEAILHEVSTFHYQGKNMTL
jgi:hypothetical protein